MRCEDPAHIEGILTTVPGVESTKGIENGHLPVTLF